MPISCQTRMQADWHGECPHWCVGVHNIPRTIQADHIPTNSFAFAASNSTRDYLATLTDFELIYLLFEALLSQVDSPVFVALTPTRGMCLSASSTSGEAGGVTSQCARCRRV